MWSCDPWWWLCDASYLTASCRGLGGSRGFGSWSEEDVESVPPAPPFYGCEPDLGGRDEGGRAWEGIHDTVELQDTETNKIKIDVSHTPPSRPQPPL